VGRALGRAVGPCRAGPGRGLRRGWSSARGWVAIHPAYNIYSLRDSGRTGVRDDRYTPAVRPRWWKGEKEGGGDSTGCFVLTRPTTCELLPGFLPTFRVPGDFDEWCGEMYREKNAPKISQTVGGVLANARSREKSRRRGRRQRVAMQ